MRFESASAAKGGATGQLRPRDGTRIRRLYDLLMAHKGEPIVASLTNFEGSKNAKVCIYYLRDFYGLDIRKLGSGRWVLAGEWIGSVYVDYVADYLAKLEREARQ